MTVSFRAVKERVELLRSAKHKLYHMELNDLRGFVDNWKDDNCGSGRCIPEWHVDGGSLWNEEQAKQLENHLNSKCASMINLCPGTFRCQEDEGHTNRHCYSNEHIKDRLNIVVIYWESIDG